jgi:hypothetical protein
MEAMFLNSIIFNQDISAWDVSSVVLMEDMFFRATVCSQIKMNFFAQNLREVSANLVKNFDTVFF